MKLFAPAIATLMIVGTVLPAYADGDRDRDNGGNQVTNTSTNTNTNNNTNRNNNRNNNTNNLTGGSSTSSSTQTTTNSLGGSTNTLVNQGTVYYPDWINVAPSQSSVSINSSSCQGPTINGAVQTLETSPLNNEYGVQGSIGISIPLGGQKDCYEVQSSIRKRAVFENAANTALMCTQLAKMNVKFDDVRFPELAACLPPSL
jgi:phospholipase/lecithinase/hemolysin